MATTATMSKGGKEEEGREGGREERGVREAREGEARRG